MPLSDQEQRCVAFACRCLGEHYGGSWSIQQYPDDLHLPEPTPDAIVGNSDKTAAVEVKRLTGDSAYQEYIASLRSNEKFLVPTCGGSYYLIPPVDFRLPMPADLRRLVKREIERVASNLSPGQKGAIQIPRQGYVSLIAESGPSFIDCLHMGPYSELMSDLREKVTGKFMLVDKGLEHSFITQECKDAFEEAVAAACKRRLEGNIGPFDWYEEWELARIDNEASENGVWIIAAPDARSMQESVEQCVHAVLENAMRKFKTRRWADLQIIVLETSPGSPASLASGAVESFLPEGRATIDHFLLVEGEDVVEASALVSSLAQAAEANERQRYYHIIESPVSEARVQRFRDNYLKGRQGIGAMEKIFKYYGAFEYRTERNDLASFGFTELVNKGPFVEGSNWADLRGWEFAVAEERHLLKNLHACLTASTGHSGQILSDKISRQASGILHAATRMVELLGSYDRSMIVLATHLEAETIISLEKALTTPRWELTSELRTNWILGKHAGHPVLYLNDPDLDNLYVVAMPRFATLIQYEPLVDLHMLPIDEATAKRMSEEQPDLGLDMSALRSMVHLTLYQSYDLQIHNRHAVWAAQFSC